ncbi:unnamed protein product [Cyprideis torosa]|uniref:Uncharacterized protein n=1 Tax=Cyprideis torosa TaxID=163714 RepID=A0A7R8W9M8_9CRUS|nr:unnamed protein product [Cyprideis torosa]CAG0889942.1 unnamed protein product [Cyprideis torosa]
MSDPYTKGLPLVDTVIRTFRVAKLFHENQDEINFVDFFSQTGEYLISSCNDDSINIYDVDKGTHRRQVQSKKYGATWIRFTHSKNHAIHASSKLDDAIRYLSLPDSKYLRYFNGHTKRVTALDVSPSDDTFLSASLDKTARIWELRSAGHSSPVSVINTGGKTVAAYGTEGRVIGLGINSNVIKLYDVRCVDKGPFVTFKISEDKTCEWTGIEFSPDGKSILISTNGTVIRTVDSFTGELIQSFSGHLNNRSASLLASYSPDSNFVFCGSVDGRIHVWSAETGQKVCVLTGDHTGIVGCVRFNPKFMMLASTCTNMSFWIPCID